MEVTLTSTIIEPETEAIPGYLRPRHAPSADHGIIASMRNSTTLGSHLAKSAAAPKASPSLGD